MSYDNYYKILRLHLFLYFLNADIFIILGDKFLGTINFFTEIFSWYNFMESIQNLVFQYDIPIISGISLGYTFL